MRHLWILLAGCLALSTAQAKVYRYVDDNGHVVFTDQPPIDIKATELELPDPNSTQMPAPRTVADTSEPAPTATKPPYAVLELQGIPDAEAIRANNGSFSLEVHMEPALRRGHRLQLLVDGEPHGQAVASLSLQADNLDRGEHQLAVQVVSGPKILQKSGSYPVTVQRTHVNSPARRAP